MNITHTDIEGLTLLSPPRFDDPRGSFRPVFAQRLHQESGYAHDWAEMNVSHTAEGSIRGLHFQNPQPQAKLITVISGTIFDVAVDLRPSSTTFLNHQTFILSADNPELPSQIYLPEGLAHGFATHQGPATVAYLVSSPWNPSTEQVLAWNDPELNIQWPISDVTLSERDLAGLPINKLNL